MNTKPKYYAALHNSAGELDRVDADNMSSLSLYVADKLRSGTWQMDEGDTIQLQTYDD